jgi:ABC-type antimicrobial peptide transport system permease subunit
MVYLPYWWRTRATTSLVLRTAAEPDALVASVRRAVAELDSDIAVGQTRTLAELVQQTLAPRRSQTTIFIAFGVVALFIATIGIYAVTAYGVSRRKREMNIRLALGARGSQVLGMILRQVSVPILAGVGVGIAGAVALGGSIRSLLFDVGATDPPIILGVVVVVIAVGLSAATIAARQGSSLDPAAALRDQ